MRLAGVTDVLGIEWDKSACDTAEAAGHKRLHADVSEVDPLDYVGITGLHASPSCQGFSMAGSGRGRGDADLMLKAIEAMAGGRDADEVIRIMNAHAKDERSALTLEPLRWALDLKAAGAPLDWVTLEQVPPVLPLWEAMADALRAHGYNVATGILQAECYGVPQTRKRAILLASRVKVVSLPEPTHSRYHPRNPTKIDEGLPRWVSMAEALGWGASERPGYTATGGGTATGGAEPFGNGARRGLARERDEGRWHFGDVVNRHGSVRPIDAPAPSVTSSADNGNFRFFDVSEPDEYLEGRGVYERTSGYAERLVNPTGEAIDSWPERRPSTTVTESFKPEVIRGPGYRKAGDGPSQNAPGGIRVSVQEAGILQSFPGDYPWRGTKTAQFRQVGDAVPPLLMKAIVEAVIS